MIEDAQQKTISRLNRLLEDERRILLDGDLDRMQHLAAEKERLLQNLKELEEPNGNAERCLRDLHDSFARNQALMNGALEGIRTVARRVASYRQAGKSMATYDASGSKQTIEGDVGHHVEKRA